MICQSISGKRSPSCVGRRRTASGRPAPPAVVAGADGLVRASTTRRRPAPRPARSRGRSRRRRRPRPRARANGRRTRRAPRGSRPQLGGDELGRDALADQPVGVARRRPRAERVGARARRAHRHPAHRLDPAGDRRCRRPRPSRPARRSAPPAGSIRTAGRSVVAGHRLGKPAASTALRPMLTACSPAWPTQPVMTSSTAPGSRPLRSMSARQHGGRAGRPGARRTALRPACPCPGAVRTMSTITAVVIAAPLMHYHGKIYVCCPSWVAS